MSEPGQQPTGAGSASDGADEAPRTGEPDIDRALESLQGLDSAPLGDHHDRLARVHEQLHQALNSEDRTEA